MQPISATWRCCACSWSATAAKTRSLSLRWCAPSPMAMLFGRRPDGSTTSACLLQLLSTSFNCGSSRPPSSRRLNRLSAAPGKSWRNRLSPISASSGLRCCLIPCGNACRHCWREYLLLMGRLRSCRNRCRSSSALICLKAGVTTASAASAPAQPIPSPAPWVRRTTASPRAWWPANPSPAFWPRPMNGAIRSMSRACRTISPMRSRGRWVMPPPWECMNPNRSFGSVVWRAVKPSRAAGIHVSASAWAPILGAGRSVSGKRSTRCSPA